MYQKEIPPLMEKCSRKQFRTREGVFKYFKVQKGALNYAARNFFDSVTFETKFRFKSLNGGQVAVKSITQSCFARPCFTGTHRPHVKEEIMPIQLNNNNNNNISFCIPPRQNRASKLNFD
eukprot:sb/3476167/